MLVIGYEIDPVDLEKMKIYETVTIKEEVPEKEYNSCDHLDDEAYIIIVSLLLVWVC